MRNIDVLMHLMYHALCDYAKRYRRALVDAGYLKYVSDGVVEVSFSPYDRVDTFYDDDFAVSRVGETLDNNPLLIGLLQHTPFSILYYTPYVVKSLLKGSVLKPLKIEIPDTSCVRYSIKYPKCSGHVFICKDISIPDICIVSNELAPVLRDICVGSTCDRGLARITINKEVILGAYTGSYWVLSKDATDATVTESLFSELDSGSVDTTGSATVTQNISDKTVAVKPDEYTHIRNILRNRGTLNSRYETLVKMLSTLGEDIPSQLDVLLANCEEE